MSYIPEEVINEVKSNVDIVELIGQYVQLNKRGTNYMASCPFHEDNNPSFSVSQPKQIYKCFSCGRGGNIFGFLQEIEGISFTESVAKAAEFANITVDEKYIQAQPSKQQEFSYLYDIHEKANDFYHYYLMSTNNGAEAYDYLIQRQLTKEVLEVFQFGLAPNNSQLLVQYLQKAGFTSEQLVDSGIFYMADSGELIDRFRNRIMIPLRNSRGDVVAFSGRVFQENSEKSAKYLNSPETNIFKKGKLIYNLDNARLPIRNQNKVLIAEGYMDVISLYQAGYENVVASMGTSLSEDHLKQLSKMTNTLIFAFDGDDAGQKATSRAFQTAQGITNAEIKAIQIPNKLDPDEWIKEHGKDSFQQLINQSISQFEFNRDFFKKDYNLNDEYELAQYIEKVIELISQIKSPIEQQLRINDLVNEYHLSEAIITEQVNRARDIRPNNYKQPTEQYNSVEPPQASFSNAPIITQESALQIKSKRAFNSEKQIIFYLIYFEEAWDYMEELSNPPVFFHDFTSKAFFELDRYYYEGNHLPLTGIIDRINDTQVSHFLTSLIWEQELFDFTRQLLDDCFKVLQQEFIQQEINELRKKVVQYQKQQDYSEMNHTLTRIMNLTRQIKEI